MQRHLVVTVGIALVAALGAASGCGSDSGAPPGSSAAAGEAMSPRDVDHHYRIQPEPRGSVVAQCSGFFLIPLEAGMPGVRVGALDLSELGRDERLVKAVREAPPGELILSGSVRAADSTLVVREVYRGMPGVSAAAGDAFYQVAPRDPMIECFAAPCDNLVATPLSSGAPAYFTTLSVTSAGAMPNVDRTWLADRALHHGAIVAGHFRDGIMYPARAERVLEADQVFIHLPDPGGICPLLLHHCPDGARVTYTRSLDRCRTFDECVPAATPCLPELPPPCAPGYTLSRWPAAGPSCFAAVCDPDFLAD